MSTDNPRDDANSEAEKSENAEGQPAGQPAATDSDGGGGTWKSGPLMGLFFTLLGGALVFVLLESLHPVFTNEEAANAFGILPSDVQDELDKKNAVFVLALLGGLAAAGLAVAEGLCRRSFATVLVGGLACAAAASLLGGAVGYMGNAVFKYYETQDTDFISVTIAKIAGMFYEVSPLITDLGVATRVYGSMFAALGAAIGLTVGIFLGRRLGTAANCVVAGILAGFLAGLSYPVICALAIPNADTQVLIPLNFPERIVWCGVTAGLLGLVIPAIAKKR